ncbi:CaiB/BaiF CoA transferase family protein [Haladaptatus sp. CMAA 1911]|uniref:CaiB/BaiF CoA transferase family protein n=1 Tax=unclassified Haladaptatus TaxID=2622732 RepID=UPI003754D5C8
MKQALDGIIIADFTQMMQGPWATQKLADMGADVIKIERIGGEWERFLEAGGELYRGWSPYFLAMNRNKRSVTLDLKHEHGRRVALDIIAEADVLVENFRPGVMGKLGLGYDDVREVNEEIVYVSGSGFGSDGPYVDRPGQDLLLQAMSGLARYTGSADDHPTPTGTAIVDEHSATLIALNTMFALFHRERTGEGQKVEANLLNAALDLQCQEITAVLNMDREFERSEEGIGQAWLDAPYGIYETDDGYVAIAMTPIDTLAEVLGIRELERYDGPKAAYEYRDEIKRTLEAYTRNHRTDDLLDRLLEADIWAAAVNDFEDVAADPQVEHNEMLVEIDHPDIGTFVTTGFPVEMSETPGRINAPPPKTGEHTDEILAELGYDETRRRQLADTGVTATDDD